MTPTRQTRNLDSTITEQKSTLSNSKKGNVTLENSIVINKNIQEVFDSVTTSRLWPLCYPETVAVGGVTSRPFIKGDLIIEKFLYASSIYSVIQYNVDEYDPPNKVTFHGKIVMTSQWLNFFFGSQMKNIGGTFEYNLKSLSDDVTHWDRKIHFYYTGGFLNKLFFNAYLAFVWPNQKIGAQSFVENVKWLLENNQHYRELWNKDM